jgi:ADP-heptose:LPS heptosyltransferase
MTLPVIRQALEQHPQTRLTVVSDAGMADLFKPIPGCHFFPAQLKGRHAGAAGIWKLFGELRQAGPFDAVVDLHGVLRSHLLSAFFRASGTLVKQIDKGRAEKKTLTRRNHKIMRALTPMHTRYAEVFASAGLAVTLDRTRIPLAGKRPSNWIDRHFPDKTTLVGVAPFARHREKMMDLEKSRELVDLLSKQGYTVLLFGGGPEEIRVLRQWQQESSGRVVCVAGECGRAEELDIISHLSAMVSMDSANMHLASLFGIPVVSIWGATHPYAGFYGWGQPEENAVGSELSCRPCSVFGNKPCHRGDHLCMQQISIDSILNKVTYCLARI